MPHFRTFPHNANTRNANSLYATRNSLHSNNRPTRAYKLKLDKKKLRRSRTFDSATIKNVGNFLTGSGLGAQRDAVEISLKCVTG